MAGTYERVEHLRSSPAKVFVTQINHCNFHWHYDYEVVLMLKGAVTVYCRDESFRLSAGDICLFNSKVVHAFERTAADNLFLCLQFRPDLVNPDTEHPDFQCHFYLNSVLDRYTPQKDYHAFAGDMARLADTWLRGGGTSQLRAHAQLFAFIADLLDYVPYDVRRMPVGQQDADSELYNRIIRYIEQHLADEDLAASLCHELGMSEKSIYRYLKSSIGVTLKDLTDITRTEAACSLLRRTDKPMPVIWQSCGFPSEVSFYRTFKKRMGCTPNDYRRGDLAALRSSDDAIYLEYSLTEALDLLQTYL